MSGIFESFYFAIDQIGIESCVEAARHELPIVNLLLLPNLSRPKELAPFGRDLSRHFFHIWINVSEIAFQPAAKIIQAGLTIGCSYESILRALAVAGKQELALPATYWKRFSLGQAEGDLTF